MTNFPQVSKIKTSGDLDHVVKVTWRLNVWQMSVNISKTAQDRDVLSGRLSTACIFCGGIRSVCMSVCPVLALTLECID